MTARSDPPAPPRQAETLLRRYSPLRHREAVEGDLTERFERHLAQHGLRYAQAVYWTDVVLFCLWYARPAHDDDRARGPIMVSHYLKIAVRTLRRHPGYAAVNVVGLALGIACCVLLLALVHHERSYDRFHTRGDRLYRVLASVQGRVEYAMPPPLGPALDQEFPEVEHAVRFESTSAVVQHGDVVAYETALFADPAFLEVFTFPLRQGDPAQALVGPGRVVLSTHAAHTYFGDADPLGQSLTLTLDGRTDDWLVTGILAPPTAPSSLSFDLLLPYDTLERLRDPTSMTDWDEQVNNTIVLLREADARAGMDAKLPAFVAAHLGALLNEQGLSPDDVRFFLQPFTAYHLGAWRGGNGLSPPRRSSELYVLAGIALLILFAACCNFMALSLGRLSTRVREVGVRKALGALRGQLVRQFLLETLLISLLALGIGWLLARGLLPAVSGLVGASLSLNASDAGSIAPALLGLLLGASLLAGGYPAFVLSRFQPVDVLKSLHTGPGTRRFTRALVVVQFTLSIGLVILTLFATEQLRFVAAKDLGFDREQIVTVATGSTTPEDAEQVLRAFKTELAGRSGIAGVTGASSAFAGGFASTTAHLGDEAITLYHVRVDPDFLETMGIDLVAGRTFSLDFPTDVAEAVLVNEAFVHRFGLKNPVGQTFAHSSGAIPRVPTIIGVFSDVHFRSLHNEIGPMVLYLNPSMPVRYLQVRVRPDALPEALDAVQTAWARVRPGLPLSYEFLDDAISQRYASERNGSRIFAAAALLAVVIGCLGLVALSAFTVERRTREIGIRKVLGASASRIVALLSRDVLVLVGLAFVLAVPTAYVAVDRLLQGYAYRIPVRPHEFVLAGLIALMVAALSVGYQTFRATRTDPVQTLRQH